MTHLPRDPSATPGPRLARRPWGRRVLLWAAVWTGLAAVFLAYLDPHLAVDLASRVWSCF